MKRNTHSTSEIVELEHPLNIVTIRPSQNCLVGSESRSCRKGKGKGKEKEKGTSMDWHVLTQTRGGLGDQRKHQGELYTTKSILSFKYKRKHKETRTHNAGRMRLGLPCAPANRSSHSSSWYVNSGFSRNGCTMERLSEARCMSISLIARKVSSRGTTFCSLFAPE